MSSENPVKQDENKAPQILTDYGKPAPQVLTDYGKPGSNPNIMSDVEGLVENEERGDTTSVLTDHGSPTSKQNLLIAVGATLLGPIGIGLTLGYSSGAIESLKRDPNIVTSVNSLSWFGSIMTIGAAAGSLIAGAAVDRLGRKLLILVAMLTFSIGWVIMITDKSSIEQAIVGRFFTGLGVGYISISVPMYIGEVATQDIRGVLGATFQLCVTIGLLLAYLGGRWLEWRQAALYSLSFNALGAVCVWIFTPNSPRWLLMQCERSEARKELAKLRGLEPNSPIVNHEIEDIEENLQHVAAIGNASLREIFSTKSLRTPLLIILVVMMGQQLNGINCVIFYAESIFEQAGMSDANLSSILLGLTQVVGTLISSSLMDKAGRRFWILFSTVGMVIFLVIFGTYQNYISRDAGPSWLEYVGLGSILLFSLSFALGEGPVPWLVIGEFFDPRAKAFSSSLCSMVNWGTSFLLAYFVADMNRVFGSDWTYWMFAILATLIGIFEYFFLPETRGKSLEEITALFE